MLPRRSLLAFSLLLLAMIACNLSSGGDQPTVTTPTAFTPQVTLTLLPTPTLRPTLTPTATTRPQSNTGNQSGGNTAPQVPIINSEIRADQCGVRPLTINDRVNIRNGPGTNYTVIALLAGSVPIVNTAGAWYQVQMPNGSVGWVSATVIQLVGSCGPPPGTTPAPPPSPQVSPQPTSGGTQCVITALVDVNAYMLPQDGADLFGTLPAGTAVIAEARMPDGWYGFDPGVAQADNQGLARLRWLPVGADGSGMTTNGAPCDQLPVVSYP